MNFTPHNDLERDLLNAQEGQISGKDFMPRLLAAELVMPVQDGAPSGPAVGGLQTGAPWQPLFLQDETGGKVLPLFTSPERARDFLRDYPDYPGGLLVELPWILERLGTGYLISLNPGCEAGLEVEADALQDLLAGHA